MCVVHAHVCVCVSVGLLCLPACLLCLFSRTDLWQGWICCAGGFCWRCLAALLRSRWWRLFSLVFPTERYSPALVDSIVCKLCQASPNVHSKRNAVHRPQHPFKSQLLAHLPQASKVVWLFVCCALVFAKNGKSSFYAMNLKKKEQEQEQEQGRSKQQQQASKQASKSTHWKRPVPRCLEWGSCMALLCSKSNATGAACCSSLI